MRCKIIEIGPDDCLKGGGFIGKRGRFDREKYENCAWLSGWFYFDDPGVRFLYFLPVRIEPEVVWDGV